MISSSNPCYSESVVTPGQVWTDREERSGETGVGDSGADGRSDWRAGEPPGRERSQYYSQGHEEEQEEEEPLVTKRGSSESGYCTNGERSRQASSESYHRQISLNDSVFHSET